MGFVSVLLLGIGLSLDSFAVSLSLGLSGDRTTRGQKVRYVAVIGLFHFLMILVGWFFGEKISGLIATWDHWVAFGLLAVLGGRMIASGLSAKSGEEPKINLLSWRNTLLFGIALSIDALISGFSLGLTQVRLVAGSPLVNILLAAGLIGLLAAVISTAGIFIGQRASSRLGQRAEVFGGIILILIGLKVLADHML